MKNSFHLLLNFLLDLFIIIFLISNQILSLSLISSTFYLDTSTYLFYLFYTILILTLAHSQTFFILMVINFILLSSISSFIIIFILFISSGLKDILNNSFFKIINSAYWMLLDLIIFIINSVLRSSFFQLFCL